MRSIKNRTGARTKTERKKYGFSIEKLLFICFIAVFFILVLVQTVLTSPTLRTFLVTDSEFEGTPLGVEGSLYAEGKIGLELSMGDCSPDIKILVNGEEAANFSGKHIDLNVKNGDVVEVDDSARKQSIEVTIVSISSNINPEGLNRVTVVSKGVKKLVKIRLLDENA